VREESARQAGQGADGVSAPNDRRATRTREDDEGRWGVRHVRGGSIFAPCRLDMSIDEDGLRENRDR
jgi:hypothetical protein